MNLQRGSAIARDGEEEEDRGEVGDGDGAQAKVEGVEASKAFYD